MPNATAEVYRVKSLGGKKRRIGFSTPLSGKKFWVKKTQATGEQNTWINLSDTIDAYYEEVPNDDTKDTTIEKKVRIRKKKSFKVANVEWWKIETKDKNDNEGYIKKSDLIELNAYDFKDFNWQIIEDSGTNYFYMFGKYVEESAPKPFVQKIWNAIGNGNKKYTVYELREAMKDVANREKLSRIIFKHPSEWAMKNKKDAFKQEYLKICEKGINEAKGKDKETDTETRKEKLTRIRDERWEVLEDKVEKLSFWDEIKNGDLQPVAKRKQEYIDRHKSSRVSMLPDSENKEYKKLGDKFDKLETKRFKRFFPKDDNVYHLHPLGFVEHMRIISSGCYCMKMGLVDSPCNGNGKLIKEEHFEILSQEMGVEKNVFKAVAKVESGGRSSFISKNPQLSKILYERHKAYKFTKKEKGITIANKLKINNNNLFNDLRGGYLGGIKEHERLNSASELLGSNRAIPIKSSSWGKFQVMGQYYNYLYSAPEELEEAQNMCEIQQFRYFRTYLEDIAPTIIKAMKDKNWVTTQVV